MPRGLKESHPLIVNMILFVDISYFFKHLRIDLHYDMSCSTLGYQDDSFVFKHATGRYFEHINGKVSFV
jgi:hypothetical protein